MLNLVSGATGLIGTHLVEALIVRGEQVRALVRPTSQAKRLRELGVELRIGTLMDNATLMAAAKGVDRVFHCAALVSDWGTDEDFIQTNVRGTHNIMAASTRAEVTKFVYLSTTDVYGFPGRPALESERHSPRGFAYSDSKIEAETLLWNHHKRVGLPITIIRPATVYGPGARLLVAEIVAALRRRRAILIEDGRHIAGLTYVGNLVDAILLAADSAVSAGQAYNSSDGSRGTWREYINTMADVADQPHPTRSYSHSTASTLAGLWEGYYRLLGRTQRPPMTRLMVELMGTDQDFPIAKAQQELGYRPRVSFEEGIRYTADWLRQGKLLETD